MNNNSSSPTQDCGGVVIIPANYAEEGVVPICIRTIDDQDRPVHRGWIEAIRPVADPFRALARRVIGNIHQVSELADGSVHALNAKFGSDFGRSPSMRLWVHAKFLAQDIAAGGHRNRMRRDVSLTDVMLDMLPVEHDFARAFEDQEFLERVIETLQMLGKTDELTIANLYLTNSEHKIAEAFGVKRNSPARNLISQRFRRGINEALKRLGHL